MPEIDFCTLELECTADTLSPAQLAAFEKIENECKTIKDKLQSWNVINKGEKIYSGEFFSAHQFDGFLEDEELLKHQQLPLRPPATPKIPSNISKYSSGSSSGKRRKEPTTYTDYEDDEDVPLVKRAAKSKAMEKQIILTPISKDKMRPLKIAEKPKTSSPVSVAKFRPTEATSLGGLSIGTDGKKNPDASSKETTSNKLQGKTFPSLVVLAKPSLRPRDAANSTRSKLDSKVKVVLMLTPSKFTEWLIQEGLLKSVQRCIKHRKNVLKLGVYSDASKFPYSGGYVWISECCPTNFISVFHGSLFENAPHPPSCILKLIYHWSCQTNIQNVVQWVKVDNVYIKGVYTWLRAICTLAVNQKMKLLGGPGKYVEIGVISLGTTSQNGQQRQVKVEVLGVLDYAEKTIRLRAIEPVSDQDRNYKKRFIAILEPLSRWVHKDSILAFDLTIDKQILQTMGYKILIQAAANDPTAKHTNAGVMDYLRKVVPRMFQNTLSLLSRQMIQQFLDELVWREQWGSYPLQAFNNITGHIAEQSKLEGGETLTQRLYQVATNPFRDWSNTEYREPSKMIKTDSSIAESSGSQKRGPLKKPQNRDTSIKTVSSAKQDRSILWNQKPKIAKAAPKEELPLPTVQPKVVNTMKGLEDVYYGKIWPLEEDTEDLEKIIFQCPICFESFDSNQSLQKDIMSHSTNEDLETKFQCIYCMDKFETIELLTKHTRHQHPSKTKNSASLSYSCLICQTRFNSVVLLTTHLQKCHVIMELPYKCGACQYRTSSHYDIINHFNEMHKNTNVIQCPLCLDVFWIYSNGLYLTQNVKLFFLHLKQHFNKDIKQECGKCILAFIDKGSLKYHHINDHQPFNKIGSKVHRLVENSTQIQAPKSKYCPKPTLNYTIVENQSQIGGNIVANKGNMCLECDYELTEENHLKALLKCQKCQFQTCCGRSMVKHGSYCQDGVNPESSVHIELDTEMHCVCGFSNSDGNSLARHLATCGHKSAYISLQVAQENIVKKSMFEMLGLVRVEEESGNGDGSEHGNEQPPADLVDTVMEEAPAEPDTSVMDPEISDIVDSEMTAVVDNDMMLSNALDDTDDITDVSNVLSEVDRAIATADDDIQDIIDDSEHLNVSNE